MSLTPTIRDTHDPEHTLNLGVTVDEAVSFIVKALEDPLNPRWCGSCIVACMIVIELDHNTADTLINANHLFGSTILAFLTAKRTIATIEALVSSWSKCKCSYGDVTDHGNSAVTIHRLVARLEPVFAQLSVDPELRKRAVSRFGNKVTILGMVIEHFAQFFVDAASKVKPFTVAKGRHPEIWPVVSKDLIPYGKHTNHSAH
jgi:hypothetical protein